MTNGRRKRVFRNCYKCLDSSRAENPGMVTCHRWDAVVECSAAKTCPYFTPNAPLSKVRRKNKRRW